jgi:DNA-directed RNA polymerase specialized sigma24 family protein
VLARNLLGGEARLNATNRYGAELLACLAGRLGRDSWLVRCRLAWLIGLVAVRAPVHRSPREQAEAVADANYEALKEVVLRSVGRRLFARSVRLDRADLEAAYNLAWHGVCQAIGRGQRAENLAGLLVDITSKRAIDIYRQRNELMNGDLGGSVAGGDDLAERVDDQQKIERLVERLKDRLNDAQRKAVTLCILQGYTRPEAARILGVEEAAFGKVMDRAIKQIAAVVATIDSRGCGDNEWARALCSFAAGAMSEDSPDFRRMAEHVRDCATCERYVMGLRGLAAVMPPYALPLARVGHRAAAVLAYARRMLAPHGAAGGNAAGAATAASSGAAASGGGWTALGAGAAKVAVAVGVAAVGTLSVHALVTHHAAHHFPVDVNRPRVVRVPRQGDEASIGQAVSALSQAPLSQPTRRSPVRRAPSTGATLARRSVVQVAQPGAVATEFGFERRTIAAPPARPEPVKSFEILGCRI